ncbi:MAG: valine--tRNA ligase [Planctomycetota bacterium]
MPSELPPRYSPADVEHRIAELWEAGGYFRAEPGSDKPPYCIVIPPPNVTDRLHLGHALNNTLQDVLIRRRRMAGHATLWMPGTDHAGIATQTVVEKRILAEEGKRRTDFERGEFVARIQAWKDEYEATITGQLKLMGCSCDWRRRRFTMDEVCAKAVREAFFKLFAGGLIYRGKRLVNWDPATQTVLADDEVEHEEVRGHFWYMQYPLAEPVEVEGERIEHVTVATTRPETMLGDTAVAMNPTDPRAEALVGKMVRLPIVGRMIPIIADDHVVLPDPGSDDEKARFSTGFLKVTPAHDPDDYAIGQRHNLPIVNVMAPDGTISDKHGWNDATAPEAQNLIGMDRFEAREAIVEWFRTENLLEDVVEYVHQVGHSYRSHVPIEPYLSDQWYIAVKKPIAGRGLRDADCGLRQAGMVDERGDIDYIKDTDVPVNSLAGLALAPLLDGRLKFTPERYAKTYQTWLENLRDWPISRQLWWGHRIPVWTILSGMDLTEWNTNLEKLRTWEADGRLAYFERENRDDAVIEDDMPLAYLCVRRQDDQEIVQFIEKRGWYRDPDVLDTWFSSALWPFSTLGWPDDTPELKAFYPTNLLCTAREIITLWVSRMVMMGQYCLGDIPFPDVFIHAMIQDGEGRKMSKSLGNGIDPLDIIDSHGADAMRFTLVSMTTQTQDVRMPVEHVTLPDGRAVNTSPKFDIGRNFANKLWNAARFALMNLTDGAPGVNLVELEFEDRWILSRCNSVVRAVTDALNAYRFNDAAQAIYDFTWHDFCDWYLEIVKPRLSSNAGGQARAVLPHVLDTILRLLHPFMPFITEELWQSLGSAVPARGLVGQGAPAPKSIMIAPWPKATGELDAPELDTQMGTVQEIIRAVRNIRSSKRIKEKERVPAFVLSESQAMRRAAVENELFIRRLANLSQLVVAPSVSDSAKMTAAFSRYLDGEDLVVEQREPITKPPNCAAEVLGELQVLVPLASFIDATAERARLEKKLGELRDKLGAVEKKLANESFISKAPAEIVERERSKADDIRAQAEAVERNLADLP